MGKNFYAVSKKPDLSVPLHIGKSSTGWKFLFQGYTGAFEPVIIINNIEDWKEYLSKENIVILDEYEEIISYKDFFDMVEEKQSNDNPNNFKNAVNRNGYRFTYNDFS